jgi:PTS system galactitol-specific IIC component
MDILASALSWFFSFKAFVMLPVVILVIALVSRMKWSSALLAALQLGAGFAGIFLVYDLFLGLLKPAVEAISATRGLNFPVVDAGWPPLAAITWASWIAPVSIALVLGLNLALLFLKATTTLYIDLWNYWHFAFLGALVLALTSNPWLAFASVIVLAVFSLKMTEWSAPHVKAQMGIEGVGVSPFSVTSFLPWAVALDALFDKIPGVRRWNWNPGAAKSKASALGQPMVLGFFLGIFLGVLAGYDFRKTAELAVQVAAILFVLPQCGGLIGQAMNEVGEALRARLAKNLAGRTVVLSLDTGFLMTNASVMATGLVLMPLALGLAFVVPGNRVLPAGDLPNLISIFSLTVLIFRGNVVRAVIAALPVVAGFLWISSTMAPLITDLGAKSGVAGLASGTVQVTAFTDGGAPVRYWALELFTGHLWAWAALVPVVALVVFAGWKARRDRTTGVQTED